MAPSYAKDQPSGFSNHVTNIAIVGAGGRSGKFIAQGLIDGGKHKLTALTRQGSTSKMPSGLHEIKEVDYDHKQSLVDAMKGQDVLIITMAVLAPPGTQVKLIDAAVEAGVPWIMPNEWGGDHESDDSVAKDTFIGEGLRKIREYIRNVGGEKTHSVGLSCGFWYEFSLAGTEARYGFDFEKKEVTFYDDGNTKISTSTFPQVGRAVANLLSLKVLPEDENDKSPCLSDYRDSSPHVDSFTLSQREMFESVLRVTGDSEKDWKISHEDVQERYKRGVGMMQQGQMVGFGILLYARMFYQDGRGEGCGDFSKKRDNERLGLPKEDLDEATKVGVEMAKAGETNMIH